MQLPPIRDLPIPVAARDLFRQGEHAFTQQFAVRPKRVRPVKGQWSAEEDRILREAVESCKTQVLWDQVAKYVQGRTPKQCRERWVYRLRPELKKTPFEPWEDELINEERKKIGNCWTIIAQKLPGRTSCSVKNRWYTVLKNRYGETSSDHDSDTCADHELTVARFTELISV